MVKRDSDGTVSLVIPPQGAVFRRQDAPMVYDITPVAYVANPEFVMARDGIFQGRVRAVQVPPERAVDIDTLLDFTIAECLLSKAGGEAAKAPS
jgi:CMP-N-acetylneuraminic acid synthetase